MNRFSLIAGCAVLVAALALIATKVGQAGQADALVRLQQANPGVQQIGNSNLSGTARAGQFVGGGAGVTDVNAALLEGLSSSAFLQSVPVPLTLSWTGAPHVISGENTSTDFGATGIVGQATGTTGTTIGVMGLSSSTLGRGIHGSASAPTGITYGVVGLSSSTSGYGVYGGASATSGTTFGVNGQSSSTSGRGVYGIGSSSTGFNFGGDFVANSTGGRGVRGAATAETGLTVGGQFSSASTGGIGVWSTTTATTGTTYAGYFENASVDGRGVVGYATAFGGNRTYGVYGQSDSAGVPGGIGVYGLATAPFNAAYGVWGQSESSSGRGVYGLATAASGTTYGVVGEVHGGNGAAYGVFAQGRSGASGTKSFRIDHPFDPENKYLLHYSSESPMPQNFYSGNVVTDSKGYAWVQLPDYFSEINVNFKYQLTVVRDDESPNFVQAQVGKKIKDRRFLVMTSAPNTEVSWRVDADRNDLYVRNNAPKDVVEKEGVEKGTYQHPELYGQPKERGMNYRPDVSTPRPEGRVSKGARVARK